MKALEILNHIKTSNINRLINITHIDEAIKELEELNSRSCIKCNTYYMKCKNLMLIGRSQNHH